MTGPTGPRRPPGPRPEGLPPAPVHAAALAAARRDEALTKLATTAERLLALVIDRLETER